ncbi:hypothetical protein N658DRAFT_527718 [Parathielavia hyrcaniae]|uniref:Uncharacterized protein n=1 Tax=Parathielavia hyrcaniae TaxID=113614 RepID=A0AAN6SXI9_9PEZI|nr:hypothetical protein N658DRAFT_527718 [Parathielavia hyrcaniae]
MRTQPDLIGYVAFEPGQTSAADNTLRDTTVPELDAASLAEHEATHYGHGMQHSSRPPEKPCGTTSIPTVLYALTTRSGIGGFHFHARRSGGGCKPDVPPRAYAALQNPISRSLYWTLIAGPRVHAGPPPVMGVSYSRCPVAAPSFCAITIAATAIRRVTQTPSSGSRRQRRAEWSVSCRAAASGGEPGTYTHTAGRRGHQRDRTGRCRTTPSAVPEPKRRRLRPWG